MATAPKPLGQFDSLFSQEMLGQKMLGTAPAWQNSVDSGKQSLWPDNTFGSGRSTFSTSPPTTTMIKPVVDQEPLKQGVEMNTPVRIGTITNILTPPSAVLEERPTTFKEPVVDQEPQEQGVEMNTPIRIGTITNILTTPSGVLDERLTTFKEPVVDQEPQEQGVEMNTPIRIGTITNILTTPSGVLEERQTTFKETDYGSGEGLDNQPNKVDGTDNDDEYGKDRNDDDSNHSHDIYRPHRPRSGAGFSCTPRSGQRRTYIEAHLGHLQKQCKQFYACTQELYSAENYHSILAGGMIQLKNFCGLLYANDGGQHPTLNTQCSSSEREAIRQKIGQELTKNLVTLPTDKTSTWHQLNSCVNANKTSNEEYIDTVCRLKKNTSHLCGDEHVNSATKVFFNHQLEQLHCSCVAIDPASSGRGRGRPFLPGAVKFSVAGGVVVLLLVLIIAVIILCLRHRKTKRKLRDHRMRYLPSAQEAASDIYQEIHDEPRVPKLPNRQTQQGKLLPHGYELDVAPSLPARYVKGLNLNQGSNQRLPSDGDDRPHSYLEPLPEPLPEPSRKPSGGPANQGAPAARTAGDNPYSLAKPIEETSPTAVKAFGSDGTYFDTIQLARKRATEDDFGYSMLKRPLSHESTAERTSSSPEYFELEPQVEIVNDAEHSDKLNLRPESDSTADRMSSNPEYFQTEHQVENVNDAKHSDTIDGVVISSTKL